MRDSSPMPIMFNGKIKLRNNDGFEYTEILNSKRNWDDGSQFLNTCFYCDKKYFANKYRSRCKECATAAGDKWC